MLSAFARRTARCERFATRWQLLGEATQRTLVRGNYSEQKTIQKKLSSATIRRAQLGANYLESNSAEHCRRDEDPGEIQEGIMNWIEIVFSCLFYPWLTGRECVSLMYRTSSWPELDARWRWMLMSYFGCSYRSHWLPSWRCWSPNCRQTLWLFLSSRSRYGVHTIGLFVAKKKSLNRY